MTKRDYVIRFLLIIRKLRNTKYATFKEINEFIQREFELLEGPRNISLRTFQRDLIEIRTIFNIDIQCNKSNQYFIAEDEQSDFNNRMMEAFDIINTLSSGHQLAQYVLLEKRCTHGTEYLNGLLYAIQNRFVLKISYHKYDEDSGTTREVEPYALKEFKGRWYLISKDRKDNVVKTFGLDRIHDLEISKQKFVGILNPNDFFNNCFGIITVDNKAPSEIVLSFDPYQGNYIKSYPLHESQKILIDNENELRICLTLYETHELLMELLSFGDNVKVIQPKSFIITMVKVIKNMNQLYNLN